MNTDPGIPQHWESYKDWRFNLKSRCGYLSHSISDAFQSAYLQYNNILIGFQPIEEKVLLTVCEKLLMVEISVQYWGAGQ